MRLVESRVYSLENVERKMQLRSDTATVGLHVSALCCDWSTEYLASSDKSSEPHLELITAGRIEPPNRLLAAITLEHGIVQLQQI